MKMSNRYVRIFGLILILICGFLCVMPLVEGAKRTRASRHARTPALPGAKSKRTVARKTLRQARTPALPGEAAGKFDYHKFKQAEFAGLSDILPEAPDAPEVRRARRPGYDQPAEAIKYYLKKRIPEGETELPVEKYFEARVQMREMPQFSTALDRAWTSQSAMQNDMMAAPQQQKLGTWTPLGPGNIGGRTRAILIHPQDPNMMYAAGVAGGVWKSANAGATWTPVADLIANIAVASLAFDPKNPDVIYAGTGEGFGNADGVRGAGIFKSADAGQTWTRLAGTTTSDFFFVHDIVVSPNDSMRLYAGTLTGVWRSLDGGATWTRALSTTVNRGCTDLAIRTDKQTDFMFAACGSFVQATVYRNMDAGAAGTWDAVLTEVGMGRTVLGIAPSNQNVVYALAAEYRASPYTDGLFAFFSSSSSGDLNSWTARVRNTDMGNKMGRIILSSPPNATRTDCKIATADSFIGQSWYNLVIAVDPADENRVWVGALDLFRTDDGGATWGLGGYIWPGATDQAGRIHPDQHAIVFDPQYNGTTNQKMYVGNDGGIYRTDNARAAVGKETNAYCNPQTSDVQWVSLNNGYAVTQFYHGVVAPDGASYFGGTQDNGTVRGTDATGANAWKEIFGADGAYGAIDFINPNIVYASTQGRGIRKSTDGGVTFSSATAGLAGGTFFINPLLMDPSDPKRLYTTGAAIFRTTNAATLWSQTTGTLSASGVSALAIAPTDANYALFGAANGPLIFSNRILNYPAGAAPQAPFDVSVTPRSGVVSWVAFDPTNRNIAYATYSTFGGAHVWRTADAGVTWTSIDGTGDTKIPDVPVHCIVVDPVNTARLYVGTDVSVFVSFDGGATWSVENTGFANVVTETLVVNVAKGVTTLYAFTHGRGAYKVNLNNSGCNYALSPTGQSFKAGGGDAMVDVKIAPTGCNWTAQSNAPWITLQPGAGGSANGTVGLKVAENRTLQTRAGTVTIAGRSFTVTQEGQPDLEAPRVAITTPNAPVVTTDQSTIAMSGTVSDNNDVQSVVIRSDRGVAISTTLNGSRTIWTSAGTVPLVTGPNAITVTATDVTGKISTAGVTVMTKPSSVLVTVAGSGVIGFTGDNLPAVAAGLTRPWRFSFDGAGNMYIADDSGHRIRKVAPNGVITTVAGTGVAGFTGDGGPATAARLNLPSQAVVDSAGNLYISDYSNHRIRKVTAATGVITTIAGDGTAGPGGDGGDAIAARLNQPDGLAIGKDGNLYIADSANNRVRKVTLADGKISTVAGNGMSGATGDGGPATSAPLGAPIDVAFDSAGDLYIALSSSNKVRKVTMSTGIISSVAGSGLSTSSGDGGQATAAGIGSPNGVAFDTAGNLYIAERLSQRIRRVNAADQVISTIAGGGALGFSPDGSGAIGARLGNPIGIGVDPAGRVLFCDTGNSRIRTVVAAAPNDAALPTVAITAPVSTPTHTATASPLALAGTATDNVGIAFVRWSNDRGGSGQAFGTTAWTVPAVSLQPGVNNITVTAWDSSGNANSAQIAVTYSAQQVLLTIAGTGVSGSGAGDGGPGIAADLWLPGGIALDAIGNLYVADVNNRRVRKIDPMGRITAFAGTGELGSGGDGGSALNATFNVPFGVAVDSAGNVYISDCLANKVRKVATDGKITTVAGTGVNFGDYTGDNKPAVESKLNVPLGIALDSAGNLYIVDRNNHRIRKVAAATGIITTVAGNGQIGFSGDDGPATQANLNFPEGVAADAGGNLYITDTGNQRIRRVNASDGKITTIAGTGVAGFNGDGIAAKDAQLFFTPPSNNLTPSFIAADPMGNVIFADRSNNRIRKITMSDGRISTLAGTGVAGFVGDGSAPTGANLLLPSAAVVDAAGNLYIADSSNNRIRRSFTASALQTVSSVSAASFAQNGALAPESIAAAFGASLASATASAPGIPLPLTLSGSTMKIRDNLGVERLAPLFFVSSQQINFQVPNGTANGLATMIVENDKGVISTGTVNIATVAPGVFAANANGQGVMAAVALRVKADNSVSYEPVVRLDPATNRFVSVPIDLGAETDRVFLVGYGTGLRFRSTLSNVSAVIGGVNANVQFAGAVPGLIGLDQFNLELGRSLAGKGEVDVVFTVDGVKANTVEINIK